ncbi:MAG TPA: hypothetical protein VNY05_31145 [Candidatus Acidoferrales bacterium]|nr:hypothetical protein [Candidatus Acidoferrales bacterium]
MSVLAVGVPFVPSPFGLDEPVRKLYGYWHVTLPGSKRGIRCNSMFGGNTGVRPPQPGRTLERSYWGIRNPAGEHTTR